MSLKIKIYSDYICPFCIISKKIFEEVIKGRDVEIEWMPFEICPEGEDKLDPPNDPEVLSLWENEVIPASKKLDMDLKIPTILPHPYTNLAFQVFHFAKEYNKENEFNNRVYKAFFYENKDIGNIDVLIQLASEVGLNKEKCLEVLKSGKYKEAQENALKEAYKDKIEIVPTFIIGDLRLEGINSREDFEEAINKELNK